MRGIYHLSYHVIYLGIYHLSYHVIYHVINHCIYHGTSDDIYLDLYHGIYTGIYHLLYHGIEHWYIPSSHWYIPPFATVTALDRMLAPSAPDRMLQLLHLIAKHSNTEWVVCLMQKSHRNHCRTWSRCCTSAYAAASAMLLPVQRDKGAYGP